MKDCEFFNSIKKLVDSLTDKSLAHMLRKSSEAIKLMEKTKYYKEIEDDIRNGAMRIGVIGCGFEKIINPNDISLIIWLTGFRVAAESEDPQRMTFQTAVYVASQKLSIHRIDDDKVRLVMTYIHLSALSSLLD